MLFSIYTAVRWFSEVQISAVQCSAVNWLICMSLHAVQCSATVQCSALQFNVLPMTTKGIHIFSKLVTPGTPTCEDSKALSVFLKTIKKNCIKTAVSFQNHNFWCFWLFLVVFDVRDGLFEIHIVSHMFHKIPWHVMSPENFESLP